MIKYTIEGQVGKIVLNRPEKFNAFNREMSLALQEALKECANDDKVRAIYFTAAGKAFSAGQDLSEAMAPGACCLGDVPRNGDGGDRDDFPCFRCRGACAV